MNERCGKESRASRPSSFIALQRRNLNANGWPRRRASRLMCGGVQTDCLAHASISPASWQRRFLCISDAGFSEPSSSSRSSCVREIACRSCRSIAIASWSPRYLVGRRRKVRHGANSITWAKTSLRAYIQISRGNPGRLRFLASVVQVVNTWKSYETLENTDF